MSSHNTRSRKKIVLKPGSISYSVAMENQENINQANRSQRPVNLGNPVTINNISKQNVAQTLAKAVPSSLTQSRRYGPYFRRQRRGSLTSNNNVSSLQKQSSSTSSNQRDTSMEKKTISHPINFGSNSNDNSNQVKQHEMEVESNTPELQQQILGNVSMTISSNNHNHIIQPTTSPILTTSPEKQYTWSADEKEWFDDNQDVLEKYYNDAQKPNQTKTKVAKFNSSVCFKLHFEITLQMFGDCCYVQFCYNACSYR